MEKRSIGAAIALTSALVACGPAQRPPAEVSDLIEGSQVTAVVTELGPGQFQVDYAFEEPQTAMIFSRSGDDYRTTDWRALSDGVRLERLDGFDALVFDVATSETSFEFSARSEIRYNDYAHFVSFSDGGLVVFTGQFELLPVADREAVLALGGDMSQWSGIQPTTAVRIHSERPMVVRGEQVVGDPIEISSGGGAFVYLGNGEITAAESYVGIIDQAMPEWIANTFPDTLAFLFSRLEDGWGFGLEEPAALLFAYEGNENEGFSNKGGVLDRQLIMQSSGQQLDQDDDYVRPYLMWFFAHEAAHLFQFSQGPQLSDGHDSWIHEGAANAMANRILFERTPDNLPYLRYTTARAWTGCIASLENGPLIQAGARGEFQAYYDCGEFIAVITDALLPDHTLYDFWNEMLDDAVNSGEGYSAESYFETLRRLGGDEDMTLQLEAVTANQLESPRDALLSLMTDVGLEPEVTGANMTVGAYRYPQ